jgi:hypothetical protein
MAASSAASRHKSPPLPLNPGGRSPIRPLPKSVDSFASQPRDKKGEALVNDSFIKAKLISEQTQQLLLRPGKKDWNLIRNQVWCFGVLADKVLNTLENSEEIRIKLPAQLQEGVKLMVQLQIERAGQQAPPPMVVAPHQPCDHHDLGHISPPESLQKPNEYSVSDNTAQLS